MRCAASDLRRQRSAGRPESCEPLVGAHQVAEAGLPGEAALHASAPRQQDQVMPALRMLDYLEADAVGGRSGGRLFPV